MATVLIFFTAWRVHYSDQPWWVTAFFVSVGIVLGTVVAPWLLRRNRR